MVNTIGLKLFHGLRKYTGSKLKQTFLLKFLIQIFKHSAVQLPI